MHTVPGVTGGTERPAVNAGINVDLGNPDGFLVTRIVRVGIGSVSTDVGLGGGTEQIPVGTLRGGEGVAVAVLGLVGTVTETGLHEFVVTVGLADHAGGSGLGLLKFTQGEIGLGQVVGGGSLGDGTHQTRLGGKVVLGILEVRGDLLPTLFARDHHIVIAGFLGHVLRVNQLTEHAGEDAVGPSAEEHSFSTKRRLHLSGGVLDLRVLVDHIDHRVGTVGEFVHIVTIVTGIAAVRGEERPVGELGVVAGHTEAVQTHAVQHPVVLRAATLVTKHHVLDVGVCRGQGDLHGRLALEEATRIISIGVLLQELFIVAGNRNYQCEKDE